MSASLDQQLAQLPTEARQSLEKYHFDSVRFRELSERLRSSAKENNLVAGSVTAPLPEDIQQLPPEGSEDWLRLAALGRAALEGGHVALVVLAGGMATRMGGVVKALVEALPGQTFLQLRLNEVSAVERRYNKPPPLWLMTSSATEEPIREALGDRLDGDHVAVFSQFVSLRLTPAGDVYLDEQKNPSLHASGHGDLPEALQKSGLLERFVQHGGRVVMMTNLDNLGGTLDPVMIGWHIDQGKPVTSEVVDKLDNDRGGIPVRVDGKLCVLEEFRIPPSFDPASVRVFNTNVFHFDARALLELGMPWTFFKVTKKVNGTEVVQFERLVNEVTSELPTSYLHVPRSGADARFLPVKDPEELEQRRAEIELVARIRGLNP